MLIWWSGIGAQLLIFGLFIIINAVNSFQSHILLMETRPAVCDKHNNVLQKTFLCKLIKAIKNEKERKKKHLIVTGC